MHCTAYTVCTKLKLFEAIYGLCHRTVPACSIHTHTQDHSHHVLHFCARHQTHTGPLTPCVSPLHVLGTHRTTHTMCLASACARHTQDHSRLKHCAYTTVYLKHETNVCFNADRYTNAVCIHVCSMFHIQWNIATHS